MNRAAPTRAVALLCLFLVAMPAWSAKATRAPELPDPGHAGMSKDKQEQLGLKLEDSRGPVQFLVIDHIEQPTPD